jgi:beta-galactosidase
VRIRDKRVWVGEESRALLSGEIHWRMDPSVWPAVLDRARELGLEIVSTYVCWDFHEVGPAKFDFTGETNPRRNLPGFIELVRDRGLWTAVGP